MVNEQEQDFIPVDANNEESGVPEYDEGYPEDIQAGYEEPQTTITKQELIKDLLVLPETINQVGTMLMDLRKGHDEMLLQMKNVENGAYLGVDSEVDANGKKLYSNELKRKTEVDNRLQISISYQNYLLEESKTKQDIDQKSLVLEFLNNRFKALRAISLLVGDEK